MRGESDLFEEEGLTESGVAWVTRTVKLAERSKAARPANKQATLDGMPKKQIATAQLMVANRLIEPLSEWALIDWAERTALPGLLDLRITKTTKDWLYRSSDKLLRDHEQTLFSSHRKLVLYDVTNTHFEGLCEANPKAKHGKNKQKRNDCRQVAVGMAFDEQGNALAYEVFAGDMADTSTLSNILSRLDQLTPWQATGECTRALRLSGTPLCLCCHS